MSFNFALMVSAVALGALLGQRWPGLAVALVIVCAPLRVAVFPSVEVATLLLVGVALVRIPAMRVLLREERATMLAMAAFLGWIAASGGWALQSVFVPQLFGKWLVVALSCWIVASLDEKTGWTPGFIVGVALLAIVPSSLWAFGERQGWILPLGDPAILENRLIALDSLTRGRALFWHPNRLAEFVEGFALLLVVTATLGVRRAFSLLGVTAAVLGVWATGSTGGMAALYGGGILGAASCWMPRRARRVALVGGGLAGLAALAIAAYLFQLHGGVGSRWIVFEFALGVIRKHPWLGIGAGNWPLAVGQASADLSRFWFRSHAHSLPLQVLAELGGVGLLLCIGFFVLPWLRSVRVLVTAEPAWRAIGLGAALGIAGLLAHDLVHYFLRDAVDGIAPGALLGIALLAARRGAATSGEERGGAATALLGVPESAGQGSSAAGSEMKTAGPGMSATAPGMSATAPGMSAAGPGQP